MSQNPAVGTPAIVAWRSGLTWTLFHLCTGPDGARTRCGLTVPKNLNRLAITRPDWPHAQKIALADVCVTCVNTFTGGSHGAESRAALSI